MSQLKDEAVLGETGYSIARRQDSPGSPGFVTLQTQAAAAVLFIEPGDGGFVWILKQSGREGVDRPVFKTAGGFCRVEDQNIFHEVSPESLPEAALRNARAKMGFVFESEMLEAFGGTLGYEPVVRIPIRFFNCRNWRVVGPPTSPGCEPVRMHIEEALRHIEAGDVYDDATVLHLQRFALEWLRRAV